MHDNILKDYKLNEKLKHLLMGSYKGFRIYFNADEPNGYASHIHYRMDDADRGNNFCTIDDFLKKIYKFIDECFFNSPTSNPKNKASREKIDGFVRDGKHVFTVLDVFYTSNKKIPMIVYNYEGDRDILINTIYPTSIRDYTIRRDVDITLREQYDIINALKIID